MKKFRKTALVLLSLSLLMSPALPVGAAVPIANHAAALPLLGLITEAVKRVIKAIDLRIQRLQNRTIWLQNAQQQLENTLSKLKLEEISGWAKKQRDLYRDYYEELMKIKAVITYYQRIRDITAKQQALVADYQRAWALLGQEGRFTAAERAYMQRVYDGILQESLGNIEHIFTIVESFTTSMSDAQRLELINAAADRIDANYDDLKLFNKQNLLLSLQRSRSKADAQMIRRMYGLN